MSIEINQLTECLEQAVRHARFRNIFRGDMDSELMRKMYAEKKGSHYAVNNTGEIHIRQDEHDKLVRNIKPALGPYTSKKGEIGNGIGELGICCDRPTVEEYAKILVLAAVRIGAERVAELFARWAVGGQMNVLECCLLNGVKTDAKICVDGVYMETISSDTKQFPRSIYLHTYKHDPNGEVQMSGSYYGEIMKRYAEKAMLCFDCDAGTALYNPDEQPDRKSRFPFKPRNEIVRSKPEIHSLNIWFLCMAISLQINGTVQFSMSWTDLNELEAFLFVSPGLVDRTTAIITGRIPKSPITMSADDLSRSLEIQNVLDSKREPLYRASFRWAKSKEAFGKEDQLIELRIALESILLHNVDGIGEKGYRLAMNGAWLLADTFEKRKDYFKVLKKVYKQASKVIHAGEIGKKEELDNIAEAQDLCRDAIIRIVEMGDLPKENFWGKLVLGGENHELSP